ncbi:MAG: hemolysin family protein [Planctomycetota bacterium]
MNNPALWVAILASALSCYFSATHYALLEYSRVRLIELLGPRGKASRADELAEMDDELEMVTATLRALLNLVILVAMIVLFDPPGGEHSWPDLTLALGVTGGIIVVFGVAIPMSWSRHAAEPLLAYSVPVLRVLYVVTKPFMALLGWFDPLVRRLLGVPKHAQDDRSEIEQDILDAVSEGEKSGLVDEAQADMIEAVVEFDTVTVDEIMTPRTDVEGLRVSSSLEEVKRFITEVGHSRVPVYETDLDHIVGVLYVKDLVPLLGLNDLHDFDLKALVREARFVPESKGLRELMTEFKASKVHMALVLDEYGGTAGLVTIEDIIEEVFGEIHDEFEEAEVDPAIRAVSADEFDVDGRVRIDDVNDELHLTLPEDEDYDTIGGFVFSTLGHIPVVGEAFEYESLTVKVIDAEKTRVNRVRIERRVVVGENGSDGE